MLANRIAWDCMLISRHAMALPRRGFPIVGHASWYSGAWKYVLAKSSTQPVRKDAVDPRVIQEREAAEVPSVRVPVVEPRVHYGVSTESDFLIGIVAWARLGDLKGADGKFRVVDLTELRPDGLPAAGRSLLHQFAHAKPPPLEDIPATKRRLMIPKLEQWICDLWVDFGYHLCDSANRQPGSVEVRDRTGRTPLGVAASQTNGAFFKMLVEVCNAGILSSSVACN